MHALTVPRVAHPTDAFGNSLASQETLARSWAPGAFLRAAAEYLRENTQPGTDRLTREAARAWDNPAPFVKDTSNQPYRMRSPEADPIPAQPGERRVAKAAFFLPLALFVLGTLAVPTRVDYAIFFVAAAIIARVLLSTVHAAYLKRSILHPSPLGRAYDDVQKIRNAMAQATGFEEKFLTLDLVRMAASIYEKNKGEVDAELTRASQRLSRQAAERERTIRENIERGFAPRGARSKRAQGGEPSSHHEDEDFALGCLGTAPIVNTDGSPMLPGGAVDINSSTYGMPGSF
jgi:hypothetical protein